MMVKVSHFGGQEEEKSHVQPDLELLDPLTLKPSTLNPSTRSLNPKP